MAAGIGCGALNSIDIAPVFRGAEANKKRGVWKNSQAPL
jgi:hypothetical protein